MSSVTRCPSCTTTFKLVSDQLRVSEGWVRCGHCYEVFLASEYLVREGDLLPAAATKPSALAPEPTPAAVPATPEPSTTDEHDQDDLFFFLEEIETLNPTDLVPADDSETISADPVGSIDSVEHVEHADLPPIQDLHHSQNLQDPSHIEEPALVAPLSTASDLTDHHFAQQEPLRVEPTLTLVHEPSEETPATPIPGMTTPRMPQAETNPYTSARLARIEAKLRRQQERQKLEAQAPSPESLAAAERQLERAVEPTPDAAEAERRAESMRRRLKHKRRKQEALSEDEKVDDSSTSVDSLTPSSPPDALRRRSGNRKTPTATARKAAPADHDTPPDAEQLSFVRQARNREFWHHPRTRAGLGLMALLCVLALSLQIALTQRDYLSATQPELKPWLAQACEYLGCEIAPWRAPDAVRIETSEFSVQKGRSPSASGESYLFSVTLRNTHTTPVATPAIELKLTDASDQVVVKKVFLPAELGAPPELAPKSQWSLAPTPVSISSVRPLSIVNWYMEPFYP